MDGRRGGLKVLFAIHVENAQHHHTATPSRHSNCVNRFSPVLASRARPHLMTPKENRREISEAIVRPTQSPGVRVPLVKALGKAARSPVLGRRPFRETDRAPACADLS